MFIKNLIDEDFTNYKEASMFVGFPHCSFKCEIDCGIKVCQNSALTKAPSIRMSCESIVERYLNNPITSAVVCGGLEPFDSWVELVYFIDEFRSKTVDDIVIYTGYNKDEISEMLNLLKEYPNIVIKFGRYIPGQKPHYDTVLGVHLASDNQYAERIS